MEFSGKVALVTGGAEGIGKGIVETLMAHGILGVAVLDINEEKGMETCKHFTSKYSDSKVEFFRCDVSEEESLKDTFFRAYQHFGRLDVVCNNAGIVDEYNWDRMLKTNLHAVIRGTYLAVELMGTKYGGNGGVVVNVSSIAGLLNQFSLCPVYCAAKYGVVGFTRSAADEERVRENNVRVLAICPGVVQTSLLSIVKDTGSRYTKQVGRKQVSWQSLKPLEVGEMVVKLIRDEDTNGTVNVVAAGAEMKAVYGLTARDLQLE